MSNTQQSNEPEGLRVSVLARRARQLGKSPEERLEDERQWKLENAEAFRSMNAYLEEHGFPFPQFRRL